MPSIRESSWRWVFFAVLAVAGLLAARNSQSVSVPSQSGSAQAALVNSMRKQLASALNPRLEEAEKQLTGRVDTLLDSHLEAKVEQKLKSLESKMSSRLGSRIDEKLRGVKGSMKSSAGAGASMESLRSKLDEMIEKRVDKLDERIDARISKSGFADIQDDQSKQAGIRDNLGRCNGRSVTDVHKEWCGLNDRRKCLDKWEQTYVREHAESLREGLDILRAPGCFPDGTSVASMGYWRTGSTLLYNTARLWLALGAGESLVAGFMCKDPKTVGIGVKGRPQERCSMLCKDHEMKGGVAQNVNVLLMSRRDPFFSVCSRKLMDVWCQMENKPGRPVDWGVVNAHKAKCKATPELEKDETITQCRALMQMQAKIYFARQSAGSLFNRKSIAYDMLMEDYTNDPSTQVRNIALALGICSEAATNAPLVKFIVQMGHQLKAHPDQSMDVTQMHDVHTDAQRKAKCSNLEMWMRSDPDCRKWMDANASSAANAELEKMMSR